MIDPEEHLLTHRAPPHLLDRALARPAPRRSAVVRYAAAAAALLAVGAAGGWLAHEVAAPAAPPMVVASVAPADEAVAVPVRLVLHAPGARHVSVAGTFNGWDPEATPLLRGSDGTFYVVLPLPPGRYEYMFVLDGDRWVADPAAPLTQPDAFGARNGILEV